MEEIYLNSLLRYSKQLNPTRETYPIPNKNWTGSLRGSVQPVTLSTYYLLDNPLLGRTPVKAPSRMAQSISSSSFSPPKRSAKKKTFSTNTNYDKSTQATVKNFDTDSEIQKILENEEKNQKRFEQQKNIFFKVKAELENKKKEGKKQENKSSKEEEIEKMQQEIESLKRLVSEKNSLTEKSLEKTV